MRITYYRFNLCRERREVWKRRAIQVHLLDVGDLLVVEAALRANIERQKVLLTVSRSVYIKLCRFNLNIYAGSQFLKDFRFKKANIERIIEMINWVGVTSRN